MYFLLLRRIRNNSLSWNFEMMKVPKNRMEKLKVVLWEQHVQSIAS